jgi:formylglycine-generating enzyme required for sulfatase activity
MVEVSWYGAVAFANWKSAEAGLAPCYDLETWECNFEADGFRLPTEAEWEKASRGGHHNPYYMFSWGSNSLKNNEGNFGGSGDPFEEEIPATTPVGYYDTPNGYGLYDMAGNVWEWCNDWWDFDYPSESPYDNPRGPEKGIIHVNRGGGYYSRAMVNSRNATRCNGCHSLNNPASGNILGFNVGFRLVSRKMPTDLDREALKRRIEGAVKSGKMNQRGHD